MTSPGGGGEDVGVGDLGAGTFPIVGDLTADNVAANVTAGIDNAATPGLNLFSSAWGAFDDFCSNWTTTNIENFTAIGDLIASAATGGN